MAGEESYLRSSWIADFGLMDWKKKSEFKRRCLTVLKVVSFVSLEPLPDLSLLGVLFIFFGEQPRFFHLGVLPDGVQQRQSTSGSG